MKFFCTLCCFLAAAMLFPGLSAAEWFTDFEKAKAESLKTNRPIYILFTNSDAAPDRSFDRTIFSQRKFQEYANKKLVLMKVDFPTAIHLQPKPLAQQNKELRSEFGITILPTALLLDANGKIYIDFIKADGSSEKHRRKMNEIMDFDPPKRYTEYLDGFVKKYKYTPPEPPKEEAKPVAKAAEKKPATKKPAKKTDTKPQAATTAESTVIPDENGGIPLVPIDPEGNFQEWLKANTAEEAAKPAVEEEKAKETVEEEKESIEEKKDSVGEKNEAAEEPASAEEAKAQEAPAAEAEQ